MTLFKDELGDLNQGQTVKKNLDCMNKTSVDPFTMSRASGFQGSSQGSQENPSTSDLLGSGYTCYPQCVTSDGSCDFPPASDTDTAFFNLSPEAKAVLVQRARARSDYGTDYGTDPGTGLAQGSLTLGSGAILTDSSPNCTANGCEACSPGCTAAPYKPSWRVWVMVGSVVVVVVGSVVGIAMSLRKRSTAVKKYMFVKNNTHPDGHPAAGQAIPLSDAHSQDSAGIADESTWQAHVAKTKADLLTQTASV